MRVANNSDEYGSYNREQHIANLQNLAQETSKARTLGTGTGAVDEMMEAAIKAAANAGLTPEEISTYSQKPLDAVQGIKGQN